MGELGFGAVVDMGGLELTFCDRRIGTVVAPVIGSYAIFNHVGNDQRALQNVQWIYLAIACFVFLLAVVFYL